MSQTDTKPSYNAGRRIAWLAMGIGMVIAAYTAGWFWFAGQVDRAVADYARTAQTNAGVLNCRGRQVRGYPFRMGVFCDSFAYADQAVTVQAGAIRSAAQIYDPRRAIVEIDSPVEITESAAGRTYRLEWESGRASVITAPESERMISFEADDATLMSSGLPGMVEAERLGVYLREQGDALDVAARPRGLRVDPALVGGRSLPPVGLDLDLRLQDWPTTWAGPARAGTGIVNRLSLLLTDDRGIIMEGPFSLSPDGLVSGEFDVRVVDVPGVLSAAAEAFPQVAPQLEMLAGAQPRQHDEPDDELSLVITVRDGRILVGFIPLGRIPPIRL